VLNLRYRTRPEWVAVVEADLDRFLQDHAANERKVSGSALRMAVEHPEREHLVEAMIDVAREELGHFQRVYRLLRARGVGLAQDVPDPYMGALLKRLRRRVVDEFLLDRLLLFAIVEARGAERFHLLAEGLRDQRLRVFYRELTRAEARHHAVFLRLARSEFAASAVETRLDELLDADAAIAASVPLRPALH
jgi:tRNA-(ms[2]io[6]A)-hydroxylase